MTAEAVTNYHTRIHMVQLFSSCSIAHYNSLSHTHIHANAGILNLKLLNDGLLRMNFWGHHVQ